MPIFHSKDTAHKAVGRHYVDDDGRVLRMVRQLYVASASAVKLVWELVSSCFGSGYWNNEKPWKNDDAWRN